MELSLLLHLGAPERPVNQIVTPFWPVRRIRSSSVTLDALWIVRARGYEMAEEARDGRGQVFVSFKVDALARLQR